MLNAIERLIFAVSGLPQKYIGTIGSLAIRIREDYIKQEKILQGIKEILIELRLQVKYLIFDLEATRRERDSYKARLEEK